MTRDTGQGKIMWKYVPILLEVMHSHVNQGPRRRHTGATTAHRWLFRRSSLMALIVWKRALHWGHLLVILLHSRIHWGAHKLLQTARRRTRV